MGAHGVPTLGFHDCPDGCVGSLRLVLACGCFGQGLRVACARVCVCACACVSVCACVCGRVRLCACARLRVQGVSWADGTGARENRCSERECDENTEQTKDGWMEEEEHCPWSSSRCASQCSQWQRRANSRAARGYPLVTASQDQRSKRSKCVRAREAPGFI